jgi:peptidoglycan/LPS O-acetylase OafA/YrhL
MSEKQSTEAPAFFAPLEALRGVAAFVVVLYHAEWTNWITSLNFVQNGALMVDFFFVLSGFVIFHSYGNKLRSGADVGRFLWLRLGRLYPLHFTFLLVFVGIELAKLVAQRDFGIVPDKAAFSTSNFYALLMNLLLVHSLGVLHHLSHTFNYPSWSVSTEFYTYVLFSGVRKAFREKRGFALAAIGLVASGAGVLLWRKIVPLTDAGYDYGFFRCVAGFFLGALIYLAYDALRGRQDPAERLSRRPWLSIFALVGTVVYLCLIDPDGPLTYLLPLLSALVILTLVLCPQRALQRVLSSQPLAWLGRVSYSVYMAHAAVVWVVTQVLRVVLKFPKIETPDGVIIATPPLAGMLALAVYVCIVLVLADFTYRWIEVPFRHASRRLAGSWFPHGREATLPNAAARG